MLCDRNPDGLRRLFAEHGGQVRAALKKEFTQLFLPDDLDSVINQAAHRAWLRAETFAPQRGTLRAWLLAIARNEARASLRRERRQVPLQYVPAYDDRHVAVEDPPPAEVTTEPTGMDRFRADFHRCVDSLSPLQRRVLLADLRAGGSASAEELASELRTSTNTIYATRAIARKVLRNRMLALGHAGVDDLGQRSSRATGRPGTRRAPAKPAVSSKPAVPSKPAVSSKSAVSSKAAGPAGGRRARGSQGSGNGNQGRELDHA